MFTPGQRVAIIGLGRTGAAAAKLGLAKSLEVSVFDAGMAGEVGAELAAGGVDVHDGDGAAAAAQVSAATFDTAVISPGVPPETDLPAIFRKAGIAIISEIEFAHRFSSAPVVGITGTNGKTTTTGLTADFLNAGGLRTTPAANYGIPYSEIVETGAEGDVATLEISSFALEAIHGFHPKVAAWLNFDADHLDRYTSLDEYRDAKLRLFENQDASAGDVAVVNAGDPPPLENLVNPVRFGIAEGSDIGISSDGRRVLSSDGLAPIELDLTTTRLRGLHNAENVMAAAAIARAMGVSASAMHEPLRDFIPPRHRCELVGEIAGVEFINDSKATNLHALASCLRSFSQPIVLIAGGKDKGLDYSPLAALMPGRVKSMVCIGEIGPALVRQFGADIPSQIAEGMDQAVAAAAALSAPGDLVILSPGTSSFCMFETFEDRGDAFRDAVRQLAGKG